MYSRYEPACSLQNRGVRARMLLALTSWSIFLVFAPLACPPLHFCPVQEMKENLPPRAPTARSSVAEHLAHQASVPTPDLRAITTIFCDICACMLWQAADPREVGQPVQGSKVTMYGKVEPRAPSDMLPRLPSSRTPASLACGSSWRSTRMRRMMRRRRWMRRQANTDSHPPYAMHGTRNSSSQRRQHLCLDRCNSTSKTLFCYSFFPFWFSSLLHCCPQKYDKFIIVNCSYMFC